MPSLAIITPSCLRVDSAIIFFMSDSVMADKPAMNIVREATRRSLWWKYLTDDRVG